MTYLICSLLGVGVLLGICVPLFSKDDSLESAILDETEWDLLQRKKEVVLGNIQDLDFEYKCGKLSESDYKQVRAEMGGEAARVLAQINELETSLDLDALIRAESSPRPKQQSVSTLEKDSPASRAQTETQTDCPDCGYDNPPANKFCAECGAKLNRR